MSQLKWHPHGEYFSNHLSMTPSHLVLSFIFFPLRVGITMQNHLVKLFIFMSYLAGLDVISTTDTSVLFLILYSFTWDIKFGCMINIYWLNSCISEWVTFRKHRWFTKGHAGLKWQWQDSNPGHPNSRTQILNKYPTLLLHRALKILTFIHHFNLYWEQWDSKELEDGNHNQPNTWKHAGLTISWYTVAGPYWYQN